MSTATATASRWTCHECGVSVRWSDDRRKPMPESWAHLETGDLCLQCRRELASESAVKDADEGDREGRAKRRKASLIEFEVRRAPERPNNIIANSCRTFAAAVAAARKRIASGSEGH